VAELRAYCWIPYDETNFILTADALSNPTLINSIRLVSSPEVKVGIKINTLFSTGPEVNCYWKMQLSKSLHVKAVLLIGDFVTKTNTQDWKLTVGDNADPLLNKTILSSSLWATEVKVGAWGQFVAIIRITKTGPLNLGYVAVFASPYDCSLSSTYSVTSLPA
jgi:hypothetical protein